MAKPLNFWLVLSIPHRGKPTTWWADSGFYLCRNPDEYHDVYAELTGPNAPRVGQCGPRVAAAALKKEAISLEWIADQESDFDDDSDDDDGVYFDDDE